MRTQVPPPPPTERAALPWPSHIPKYPPTLATASVPGCQLPCSQRGWVLGPAAPTAQGPGWRRRAWDRKPSLTSGSPHLPTGNMLLCLSPAWLTKVPAPGRPGEAALLVSKAVSFHPGGLSFLDDFVPQRQATYFLVGLGPGPGQGREAAELARDLTCPTGASAELARLLEDRLLTRLLLAQRGGVAVPATLAFAYKPPALLRGGAGGPGLRLVELSGREGQETLVKEEVGAFLHSEALGDALQVTGSCPGGPCRCHRMGPSPAGKLPPTLCPVAAPLLRQPSAFCLSLLMGSYGVTSPPAGAWVVRKPLPLSVVAGGHQAQQLALAGAAGTTSAPTSRGGHSGGHSGGIAGETGGGGECPGGGCVPTCPAALPR